MFTSRESHKLICIYDPTTKTCKVIKNGRKSCVRTPDTLLFEGSWDEVDKWIEEREEKYKIETEGWLDVAPLEPIEDKRSIRNDYVPKNPIHPKVKE